MSSSRAILGLAVMLALPITAPAAADPDPQNTPEVTRKVAPVQRQLPDRGLSLPAIHELQAIRLDPEVRACVDDLADPSYERREEAMVRLMDSRTSIEQLCAALQEPQLTAEQEYRLLMIVRKELLTAPRGAVGIKVDQRWWPNLIIVEELIDGLPAAEVLKIGDRITHLQGKKLRSWTDFRRTIQSRAPGDAIAMTIARPLDGAGVFRIGPDGVDGIDEAKYETKKVEIKLGSAELLIDAETGLPQRNGDIDRQRLSAANEATKRWAPRAMTLKLDGPDDIIARDKFDYEVESNSHVQTAIREQARIEQGALVLTTERRAERIRQLEIFKRLASDPTLSPEVRDMHRRLAERYAQLIGR